MRTKNMRRFVAIIDTGAGSSVICQGELPQHVKDNIKRLQKHFDIKKASGKPLPIAGKIRLSVEIGAKKGAVQFVVAETLAIAVILYCDYCDQHVESIKPR